MVQEFLGETAGEYPGRTWMVSGKPKGNQEQTSRRLTRLWTQHPGG